MTALPFCATIVGQGGKGADPCLSTTNASHFELRHLADLLLLINCKYYFFEMANPRHEHEWRVWQEVSLPPDKALVPGCISPASPPSSVANGSWRAPIAGSLPPSIPTGRPKSTAHSLQLDKRSDVAALIWHGSLDHSPAMMAWRGSRSTSVVTSSTIPALICFYLCLFAFICVKISPIGSFRRRPITTRGEQCYLSAYSLTDGPAQAGNVRQAIALPVPSLADRIFALCQ